MTFFSCERFFKYSFLFLIFAALTQTLFAKETYDGQIVPKDFVAFVAPQNTLNLPFWGSSSNGIQLINIEKEGKQVKAGDLLAEFKFRMHGAQDQIERQSSQIMANNEKALLNMEKVIVEIRQKLESIKIKTQQAKLDLQKKSHLSQIRQKILDCDFAILSFETEALQHKLEAARQNLEIHRNLFKKREGIWANYFAIYDATKARFKINSPTEGYLFYPMLEKHNRKIRSGDNLNSGVHFLSLAKSEKSELLFYLPEKDLLKVKPDDRVFIIISAEEEVPARVIEVGFFPQLVGDVMQNYRLPNAWDKCFIVKAEIEVDLQASALGSVKVRLAK